MRHDKSVSPAKKAIVLAAGLGTRLRPLTCATPKPLLPVWGVPMLERILDTLRGWGVEEFAVNAHYLSDQVRAWAKDQEGVRVSVEDEILGTGGVLNPLRDWIGDDDFYLVNGDIVLEGVERNPFAGLPRTFARCLLTEEGPRTVESDPEGRITCWKSPDPGYTGTYTYCGVALLTPEILEYVPPTGFSTIVEAYEKAAMDAKFVVGTVPDGMMWTDAGTVASYLEINATDDDNAYGDLPQVKAACDALGEKPDKVGFLGARGSDRIFFRIGDNVVIVYDDAKRAENARYAGHARWLADHGVGVPAVTAELPEMKTLALAWAGEEDNSLEASVKVVEALARFNALGDDAAKELELEPAFGPDLWTWERDLFAEYCLGHRYLRTVPDDVAAELEKVAERLEREPKALVHRDFQSSNVLWRKGKLQFIDFQGMRLGPAAYDLASFLYNPYVAFTESERRALVKVYEKASGRADIAEVLPFAAVQRLVQCLGAYGRLASVGQPQFAKYVLPALENLLVAADEAGLDAIGALAEDLIALEAKHGHTGCHCHDHDSHDHDHGDHHACSCGRHRYGPLAHPEA